MGWKKAFKKVTSYLPGVAAVKAVKKAVAPKGDSAASEPDARAEAAGGLIRKNEKKQAGAGQIEYTSETQV